jgi:hypothetical protein
MLKSTDDIFDSRFRRVGEGNKSGKHHIEFSLFPDRRNRFRPAERDAQRAKALAAESGVLPAD